MTGDNPTLFLSSANNYIGIGTNNPTGYALY